jgi:hypothetical protein
MSSSGRRHDRAILDALEAMDPQPFSGDVWRVTGRGRDPLRGSTANGRWSPAGEFEALYTSLEREGALAEIGHRLSLEPVWPSRAEHDLHRISADTERTLRFADVPALVPFGIDAARYGSYDYMATQAVAAAACFLGFDGIIVPSARSPALHLVIFLEQILAEEALVVRETQPVDWAAWRKMRSK